MLFYGIRSCHLNDPEEHEDFQERRGFAQSWTKAVS